MAATMTDKNKTQLTLGYWREGDKLLAQHAGSLTVEDLDYFFPTWLASLDRHSLCDARPWITFTAARFLEELLSPEWRVFEYGAGGSTLFFAERVRELITVEHDQDWLHRTAVGLRWRPTLRWHAHLVKPVVRTEPTPYAATDPLSYASTDPRYEGMSFRDYAASIERYDNRHFDLILIDGRARPACFMHSVAKVKLGGYIVLDNAEREQYAYVEQAARRLGFEVREFWGPGPYNQYFWRTIFLRKTVERFALNDLDTKLEAYLDFDGGTFIEAGANDGVNQSNTLYFEDRRGWRGLLVEPVAERAAECQRFRPRAIVENAALVPAENAARSLTLRYADLMSVIKGGMHTQEEEDAHIQVGCTVQNIQTHEFTAPTTTLSNLLDKHKITHVDLLSLDVEGYELNVLKGLDLARHRPRFILVEARYREEVHAFLSQQYELVAELSHHDLLYRLRGEGKEDVSRHPVDPKPDPWAAQDCIACGTRMTKRFAPMFDDRYGYPGYFSLYRCPSCKQLQTVPMLEDADLSALYGNYYPRREIDTQALLNQVGDPASVRDKRRRWLSGTRNQGQYGARPGMVVLDYGCGAGLSLLELEKLGAEAYGLEADPNVRQVIDALKLRIHIGTIDENPFPGVNFDLIVLNQVFEHIPRPDLLLPKLAARLKPGGRVVLSFPNSSSIFCRFFGRDWINWHIPYHLHHFNPRSARRFFARHGWDVISLRTITPNLWTVLQLRAAVERTRMGVPHPMWTGQAQAEPMELDPGVPVDSRFSRTLHRLARRSNERLPRFMLAAFNRICDAMGLGDSILLTISPPIPGMTVYALIPVHNRLKDTQQVIACLRHQTHVSLKIVVIDDGSDDGTDVYLAQQGDVTTLKGDGNLWWGGAMNLGLSYVLPHAKDSDHVLFMNNDITIGSDFVATLIRTSQEQRDAVVGAILRDVNHPETVLGLAPVVDIWGMRVWERFNTLPDEERINLKPVYEADAISGRGTLYPVRAFRVGGQLYPRLLPHYYADYELAMRMRRHGFPLVVSTQAIVFSRNEFTVQRQNMSWFEAFFGQRSHRNFVRRAVFFSLVGTPRERLTAVPRMAMFALERAVHTFRCRRSGSLLKDFKSTLSRSFALVRSFLMARFASAVQEYQYVHELKQVVTARRDNLRVIVGSSGTAMPDWVSTEYPYVDITNSRNLRRFFENGEVSAILAEHVWEHLTAEQAREASRNCFNLLRPGGYIRIAVPDGNHPDPAYIDYVRPGGHGAGSDDHKVLYTLNSLREVFTSVGFQVEPLEWFDASGKFHAKDWDPKDGHISRSTRFDERNRENPTAYTSLIIDGVKPAFGRQQRLR